MLAGLAKFHSVLRWLQPQFLQPKLVGANFLHARLGQCLRQLRMIKRGFALTLLRIDEDELVGVRAGLHLIPELRIARQPVRLHAVTINFVLRELAETGHALVVGAGALGVEEGESGEDEKQREQNHIRNDPIPHKSALPRIPTGFRL